MTVVAIVRLALSATRRFRGRTMLAMLGVGLAVFAVIVLVSAGAAARGFVEEQLMGLGTDVIRIVPGRTETRGLPVQGSTNRPITMDDVEYVKRHVRPGVLVSGQMQGNGTLAFEGRSRSVLSLGVDETFLAYYGMSIQAGRFFDEGEVASKRLVCVIGPRAKQELFGSESAVGRYVDLYSARFRVIGVTAPKGVVFNVDLDDAVFFPRSTAAAVLNLSGVEQLLVKVPDREVMPAVGEEVRELMLARHEALDFTVVNPDDLLGKVNGILTALTILVGALGAIALVVGAVGIANVMLLSVRERVREIGVRRAIGARRRDILLQFVCEAALASALGGVGGLALGLVAVGIAHYGFGLATGLSPLLLSVALVFSLLVGVLAGLAPAWRASRVSPVEAMRTS